MSNPTARPQPGDAHGPAHGHPGHTHGDAHDHAVDTAPRDAVDAIVPSMPIVLPVVGGVLMFLLAFIAIYMA